MKLDFETDDGIGTRATLGLVVLETDETVEPEFRRIADLPGVALYHSRIPMVAEIRPDTLARMEQDLPASARLFPESATFDVIGYGCTSASSVIGSDKVAQAIQRIRPEAKVTDPLAAVIAGSKALGAKRLGFLTPYVPEVSHRMRQRLEDAGFDVPVLGSFEEGDDRVVARITEASICNAAIAVADRTPCDAIVISCTNLRCLNIIAEIENRTGLPVLSSNLAMAWHMMRLAGIDDKLPECGRLFTKDL
ncbi:MAG: maleate cis-trans isomerase family protein [Paracoccaceae bacterium]